MGLKPVAIFRHARTEGPGHFATFLQARRVPWQLVKLDIGEAVPRSSEAFAGLAFMGGPMSANDKLPWTEPVLALLRDAVEREVPVIGHCLGGQLLARALGATVRKNLVKEIGWQPVRVEDSPAARAWFGTDVREFVTFQWHGDTFAIPPGAERILSSEHCANQAYVAHGRHLGLQCHVEMTPEMIESWLATGTPEIEAAMQSPAVQDAAAIRRDTAARLPVLTGYADRLYRRWVENLRA